MKKSIHYLMALLCAGLSTQLSAQCVNGLDPLGRPCRNAIQTAVPFLRITPDARSGGMGDAGIAISADPNALHFNVSKMALSESSKSVSMTYTPWFRNVGSDNLYLLNLAGFKQFGNDKNKQAFGIDVRYFSFGTLDWMDENGTRLNQGTPREMSLSIGYARQLTEHLSVGVTGKYIYSNLATGSSVGSTQIKSGKAGAVDVSLTYKKPIQMGSKPTHLTLGAAISNLGNKISYLYQNDFLPTNLGIGAAWEMSVDAHNSFTFALDANKLLVPTPDAAGTWRNVGVVKGLFQSFSDDYSASGEKLREFTWSTGAEYWYDKQFAIRTGYFYEHPSKGSRQYWTTGIGFKTTIATINASYLVPMSVQRNPLGNILRFSLLFDLKQ